MRYLSLGIWASASTLSTLTIASTCLVLIAYSLLVFFSFLASTVTTASRHQLLVISYWPLPTTYSILSFLALFFGFSTATPQHFPSLSLNLSLNLPCAYCLLPTAYSSSSTSNLFPTAELYPFFHGHWCSPQTQESPETPHPPSLTRHPYDASMPSDPFTLAFQGFRGKKLTGR
jgi:hypothetical protein